MCGIGVRRNAMTRSRPPNQLERYLKRRLPDRKVSITTETVTNYLASELQDSVFCQSREHILQYLANDLRETSANFFWHTSLQPLHIQRLCNPDL